MKQDSPYPYDITSDVQFGFLKHIDVNRLVDNAPPGWSNRTLCEVNDCVIRLGVVHGDFHWHKHDNEDEFFYVVRGTLFVDIEGATVELKEHQGYTVPKGVLHRTRAPEPAAMLMFEGRGVTAVGDD